MHSFDNVKCVKSGLGIEEYGKVFIYKIVYVCYKYMEFHNTHEYVKRE